jgi:hypothetical protein
MKLYISATSPFARKVRVLLIEKQVPHEVEVVDLWSPNELQQINPIGKVPALVLDDGRAMAGSAFIADWVDGRYPRPRFIPADDDGRLEARRWESFADGVMDAVAAAPGSSASAARSTPGWRRSSGSSALAAGCAARRCRSPTSPSPATSASSGHGRRSSSTPRACPGWRGCRPGSTNATPSRRPRRRRCEPREAGRPASSAGAGRG